MRLFLLGALCLLTLLVPSSIVAQTCSGSDFDNNFVETMEALDGTTFTEAGQTFRQCFTASDIGLNTIGISVDDPDDILTVQIYDYLLGILILQTPLDPIISILPGVRYEIIVTANAPLTEGSADINYYRLVGLLPPNVNGTSTVTVAAPQPTFTCMSSDFSSALDAVVSLDQATIETGETLRRCFDVAAGEDGGQLSFTLPPNSADVTIIQNDGGTITELVPDGNGAYTLTDGASVELTLVGGPMAELSTIDVMFMTSGSPGTTTTAQINPPATTCSGVFADGSAVTAITSLIGATLSAGEVIQLCFTALAIEQDATLSIDGPVDAVETVLVQSNLGVTTTLVPDENGDFTLMAGADYNLTIIGGPVAATSLIDVNLNLDPLGGGGINTNVLAILNLAVLPVDLVDFSGHCTGKSNQLEWVTAREVDNKGFAVERSENGNDWKELGYVDALGASASGAKYAFTDAYPLSGKNYYRLRQEDQDGTTELSHIITVATLGERSASIIAPNPAHNTILLNASSLFDDRGAISVRIFDQTGAVMLRTELDDSRRLDVSDLPAGMYVVSLASGQLVDNVRFIKR